MTGCVLRACGVTLSPESFLASFPFPNAHCHEHSFNISIGKTDGADLSGQIQEALVFLAANSRAIKALVALPGVEASLDFGLWLKDTYTNSVSFPPALTALAGALGIGIDATLYPAAP
jgi:hypothetical protein